MPQSGRFETVIKRAFDLLFSPYFVVACSVAGLARVVSEKYAREAALRAEEAEARQSLEKFLADVNESYRQDLETRELETQIDQDETTTTLKVPAIIEVYKGYACEIHHVHTNDGYILEMHRVIYTPAKRAYTYPVILQHGLLSDSSNWVLNGGDRHSLAFALAERGHDVWLSNSRGNHYSKDHERWDSSITPGPYWNFTWYEMATRDLPAVVDYVLANTQMEKLHYCGHSQGTLIMFAALDIHGSELQSKIASFHALAPVAYLGHMKSPMRYIANSIFAAALIYKEWPEEILPRNKLGLWISDFLGKFIGNQGVPNMLTLIFGFHPKRYVLDKISTYLTHTPAGTSFQDILHFAQIIRSDSLQSFQVGRHGKVDDITLQNIKCMDDIYLYVGSDDEFCDYEDIGRLEKQLLSQGNIIIRKNIEHYDHLCFIWGNDAYYHIYQDIVKVIETNLPGRPPELSDCTQS